MLLLGLKIALTIWSNIKHRSVDIPRKPPTCVCADWMNQSVKESTENASEHKWNVPFRRTQEGQPTFIKSNTFTSFFIGSPGRSYFRYCPALQDSSATSKHQPGLLSNRRPTQPDPCQATSRMIVNLSISRAPPTVRTAMILQRSRQTETMRAKRIRHLCYLLSVFGERERRQCSH